MVINSWDLIGQNGGYFLQLVNKEYNEEPKVCTIPISDDMADLIIADTKCDVSNYPF